MSFNSVCHFRGLETVQINANNDGLASESCRPRPQSVPSVREFPPFLGYLDHTVRRSARLTPLKERGVY